MISPATISEYIDRQVAAFKKIALRDFLIEFQEKFHPEQDISLMDYFLELSKKENEGQFIVHHEKLYEYGVATKKDSTGDIRKRLDALIMSEGEDYQLRKLSQQSESSRGVKYHNVYMLTPECFKTIMIGASKHKKHEIDVTKYRNYYLFLEKAVGYYMDYQLDLEKAYSSLKDQTIDRLSAKIDEQNTTMQKNEAKAQERFEVLLERNDTLIEKNDLLFEVVTETNEFAKEASMKSTCPAKNATREPFFGMTYLLIEDADGSLTIRSHMKYGKCSHLNNAMIKLITGKYKPSQKFPVVRCHKIAIPPIYFPSQGNLTDQAKAQFIEMRSNKVRAYNKAITDGPKNYEKAVKDHLKACSDYQKSIVAHDKITSNGKTKAKAFAKMNNYATKIEELIQLKEDTLIEKERVSALTKITVKDIPIKWNLSYIDFKSNPFFSFEDVISIFTSQIQNTQGCSYNSPTSDILRKISKDNKAKFDEEFDQILNTGKDQLRENADEV